MTGSEIASAKNVYQIKSSCRTSRHSFIVQNMSAPSNNDLINLLNAVSTQITRYGGFAIFLFGIIGNILNILVLSQRSLRSNPCAWLFFVSSVAYLISLFSGVFPRFLSTWDADFTSTNQFFCKLRIFIYFDSLTVAFWLVMLATVDRWLSSSMNAIYRRRSTLRNAQRAVIAILILTSLLQTQQIFCYEANLVNTPLKCYTKTVPCGILSDITFAVITVLIPLLLMFAFGLLIISNIRRTRARLRPMHVTADSSENTNPVTVNIGPTNQQKKTDRQLLMMLFVQVLVILVFTLPFALSKLYTTLTRDTIKSALQRTIENFIFNLFLLSLNVASGMPFYIYTLTGGSVFRKALFNLIQPVARMIPCQCS